MSKVIRALRRVEERWDGLMESYHTNPLVRQTKRRLSYYAWTTSVYCIMGLTFYVAALNVVMIIQKERKARMEGPILARKQRDNAVTLEVINAVAAMEKEADAQEELSRQEASRAK
eukprot:Hpha_TRINITY_DN31412_c0_g1::TRINITY_DN31412_c0_g1_i1::g.145383::m.145383